MRFEEEITGGEAEEIEEEAKEMKRYRRPRTPGLLLTIFGAVVVVLIGGLASYYYYTFQSQGAAGEKKLKQVWNDTVGDTSVLTARFKTIDEFGHLNETGTGSLGKLVDATNQTIRDGLYDIRAQGGMSIKASTVASKLSSFLEDYSAMLAELKRVISRVDEISDQQELNTLKDAGAQMEKSYDALLLAGSGIIQANLPRAVFDVPGGVEQLLAKKIEEGGSQSEQEKAAKQAAEQTVTQFVQAWQNRDPDGMSAKLTKAAKTEFNPGIVEDSTDITNLRITASLVAADLGGVTITGELEKQTPDKTNLTETWEFKLLKQADSWLIDKWAKK